MKQRDEQLAGANQKMKNVVAKAIHAFHSWRSTTPSCLAGILKDSSC